MIIHGLLLLDPSRPPVPGWVRVYDGRIVVLRETGERPPNDELAIGGVEHLITPGFIDAHIHLPQIDSVGCDGMPLLHWLDTIVYPAEAWWGRGAARSATRRAKQLMLTQGTLGFAGWLTSHGEATRDAIAELERGPALRAIVGRVAMDRSAPDDLTAEDRWRAKQTPRPSVATPPSAAPRINVSINPRFAPACSEELLAEIGWTLQEQPGEFVQTHLAENIDECELVASLFPDAPHYTGVYDRVGLLSTRTLLAHCIHLSHDEWGLIAARGAVVVHCPTANVFLESGLFNLDAAREHGVRLALGSDVAAGPDVAMPRVARAMIETAKLRKLTNAPDARVPSPADAWRLITEGNADALGWSDSGRIATGAWADLLVLRPRPTWLDEHLVGRLIYNWSPDLITHRIVAGHVIDPATI